MKWPILFIVGFVSAAGIVFALLRPAPDRGAEHIDGDARPSHNGALEKSENAGVQQRALEPTTKSGRAHDGARDGSQGGGEQDGNLLAQQPTHDESRADPSQADSAELAGTKAGQVSDASEVGRAFPVSESVVEACKPARPGEFRWEACNRINELLIEMARESRSELWAAPTEKLLRAYAEREPGKFTIRALECRRTICFIEAASIFGGLPDPDVSFMRSQGFRIEYHTVDAFETDDAGARLTVTLAAFTRS